MLEWVVIPLAAVFCLLGLTLIVLGSTPIRLSCGFAAEDESRRADVHISFPLLFSVAYSTEDGRTQVWILGRESKPKSEPSTPEPAAPVRPEGTTSPDPTAVPGEIGGVSSEIPRKPDASVGTAGTSVDDPPRARRETPPPQGHPASEGKGGGFGKDEPGRKAKKPWPILGSLKERLETLRSIPTWKLVWVIGGNGPLWSRVLNWLKRTTLRLLQVVAFDAIVLRVKAGLGEPDATGKIYGYWKGIEHALMLPGRRDVDVRLEPRFDRLMFEIGGRFSVRTSVYRLVVPVVVLVFTFPYFTLLRVLWRASDPRENRRRALQESTA